MGSLPVHGAWIAAGAAFLLSLALTRLLISVAPALGFSDHPGERKSHPRPTPLLGGAGIFAATALVVLLALRVHALPRNLPFLLIISLAAVTLGVMDDYLELSPWPKVIGLVLIAALPALYLFLSRDVSWPHAVSLAAALFFFANAVNLFDNADGTCAATGSTIMLLAWVATGNAVALIASAALAGFLVWNLPPARIFMGDAGSLLIGVWCVFLCLSTDRAHTQLSLAMLPALWLFVYDTLSVIVVRIGEGRSILVGGSDHVVHRLIARGIHSRTVIALCIALTAAPGFISVYFLSDAYAVAFTCALCAGMGALEILLPSAPVTTRSAAG